MAAHRDRLVAYARRSSAGADSEDIAQEALIRAYLSGTMDEARALPYLLKIVENLARSRHRHLHVAETLARVIVAAAPSDISVEDRAAVRDLARRALRHLRTTEPTQTVEMVLRRAEGTSWLNIAREFEVTATAAESRVRRALLRLRAVLAITPCSGKNLAEVPSSQA